MENNQEEKKEKKVWKRPANRQAAADAAQQEQTKKSEDGEPSIGDSSVSEQLKESLSTEIGNVYFRMNENGDYDYWRIMRIQNANVVSCEHNWNPNDVRKFRLSELYKNCMRLESNAILTVSRVIVGYTEKGTPINDIVVMVYDKNKNSTVQFNQPSIICRQAISDVFYQPFCKSTHNPMVGISVTPATCPAEYTMKDMAMCDQVLESMIVNLYRTDTLASILRLIKPSRWNNTLEDLLTNYYNNVILKSVPYDQLPDKMPDTYHGYCRNIELLLWYNNFIYDFYAMMGIQKVKFKIDYPENIDAEKDEYILPQEQVELLQELYQVNMEHVFAVPFDYSLDLEAVKLNAVLVMDSTDTLYVIGFTKSKNEYSKVIDTTAADSLHTIREKLSKAVDLVNKYEKSNG
ncbi:hypothetical protein [Bacteroides acidifaciens]|uniref:hypothetical protein n=1 Tax=Bacteroides acidifaciens TaxID=85831 RepID=UPI00263A4DCF|nr:hypothetical protein [Bacteroides acidifaciens]